MNKLICFLFCLLSSQSFASEITAKSISQLQTGMKAFLYDQVPFEARASDRIDWNTFYDLNSQAESTWQQIENCPGYNREQVDLKQIKLCRLGAQALEDFRASVGSYLLTIPAQRVQPVAISNCNNGQSSDYCSNLHFDLQRRSGPLWSNGGGSQVYSLMMSFLPSLDFHPLLTEVLLEYFEEPYLAGKRGAKLIGMFGSKEQAAFDWAVMRFQQAYVGEIGEPLSFSAQEVKNSNGLYKHALKYKDRLQKSMAAMQTLEMFWLGLNSHRPEFGLNEQMSRQRIVAVGFEAGALRKLAEYLNLTKSKVRKQGLADE